jgi:type III secretion protein U
MAKEKGGDQTEKPTPKRLRDARREGDIAKSKELTSTILIIAWLAMAWLAVPLATRQIADLFERAFQAASHVGTDVDNVPSIAWPAVKTLLIVSLPLLVAAILIGVLTEYLQVGSLFAPKRVAPKAERMNPAEGLKRMFSQDNLVELVKSILKAAALGAIFYFVMMRLLPEFLRLQLGTPSDLAAAHWHGLKWLGIWTICTFLFVAALDIGYQRYSYIKKLRMSRREIKQEMRDTEGDPLVKGRRRQLHQEWAQQNMLEAVRKSTAVVVNPEHIAVAILYEPGSTELPVVCAKGEDYEAQLIREAAEQAGVPIMRNVELARGLHENVGIDEYITAEFFQAVAELLRWAESIRTRGVASPATPDSRTTGG